MISTRGLSDRDPALSPDGNWLAYVSRRSGVDEVFVRPYPGPGAERPVSTAGGYSPAWNPNGDELVYLGTGFGWPLLSVEVRTEPDFGIEPQRKIFLTHRYWSAEFGPSFDFRPDGQLIMLQMLNRGNGLGQINVLSNWPEDLRLRSLSGGTGLVQRP